MTDIIAGFVCALILAALVIAWITYCMFFREKHRSEKEQYHISDLRHKNYQIAQEKGIDVEKKEMKGGNAALAAGVFILPALRRHRDEDYVKRPDYPESPVHNLHAGNEKLVEIFTESAVDADVHNRDFSFEVNTDNCASTYQSDV